MSREVDTRVVEMQFNNADFEKNTKTSIKSIDRLMEKLQFKGAEKGFEKLDAAAENVDFDGMARSLDKIENKFSAFNIVATTALMNITNKVVDAGEKLVKSLSLDQVTAGWTKYAQKTASVQTIMNATGKSITKVNSYLDKLMWYSDETSYGFTDMTAALSTLTSAGGNIEKMIPMIMGMANATAYAGKGATEFQRVIYNLAQSYGTGALQLIDWKSVEQAGVASQQLKQLLIDTGVELGKIKKGAVTTGSFDNSLQKKWADRQVMETAFGKFAEFSTAVKSMVDANPGMLASQAIDALADQYDAVTVKAFKAAQEAKSFSEAVDATKDAVSTGWMKTFDILFGNYEEAKGFWSGLTEEFWDIFASGASVRNNWLASAFDSGLDQLLGTEGFSNAMDDFTNSLQKSLVRRGLLTEEGIEEAGSFQKALEESGVTARQLADVIWDQADGYARMLEMSDEQLNAHDLDRDKIQALADAYASMAEKIQNGTVDLSDFADKMNQLSGREHFFNGILNILHGINTVLEPVRDAFDEVFMTDGGPLYNLLKGFDELTGKMQLSEDTAEKIKKVFKGFFSTVGVGLKAAKLALRTVCTVIGKVTDVVSPVTTVLLNIGSGIGDLMTYVNYSLGYAESFTDVVVILAQALGGLLTPVVDLAEGFCSFVRTGDLETAKDSFGAFGAVVDSVGQVLDRFKIGSVSASSIIGKAVTVLGSILFGAFDGVGALIRSGFAGFQSAGDTVPMLETIRDTILSIPEKATALLSDFGGTIGSVMANISTACMTALDAVKDFFNLQEGVDVYRLLALVDVGALALAIYGVAKAVSAVSSSIKKLIATPATDLLTSMKNAVDAWTKQHTTNNLATIAKGIATAVGIISVSVYLLSKIDDPKKALTALGSVMVGLFGMVTALHLLTKADITGLDTAKLFGTITAISLGLTAMAGAVAKIGKLHTYQVQQGVEAVRSIAVVLTGMVGLIGLFNTKLTISGAGGFVAAAAAIDMIALALIPLALADQNGLDIAKAADVITGVASALSVLMIAAGIAQKLSGKISEKPLEQIVAYLAKLGGVVLALNGIGSALLLTAGAVAAFAAMGDSMWTGLAGAGAALAGLAAVLGVLTGLKLNSKRMKRQAEAMLIASSALVVMAGAVALMGQTMASDTSGAGFAGITLGLIELSAAMYVLGKNSMESTAAATAMVAMGAALIEMAAAIKLLAGVDTEDLAKGILTMAAALGVLAAGVGWLSASAAGITSLAGACLMLATALLILTPAFKGLASLSWQQALAGVIGIAGILGGLAVVGQFPTIAIGMNALAASMIGLAKAFNVFAGGLIKFSIAAGILSVLAMFADPVCQAIVEAAPDIEAALIAVVTVICDTINACAEPIGEALTTVLKILIQTVVDVIAWAWNGEGGDGEGIKGALDVLWNQFLEWCDEHKNELSKVLNPFDPAAWVDTFTAKDRPIGWMLHNFTDPFLAPFGTSLDELGNQWEDKLQGVTEAEKKNTEAHNENTKATEENAATKQSSTKKLEEHTTATNIATKAQEAQTAGLVQLVSDTGEITYATMDQANAMMRGAEVTADAAAVTGESAAAANGNVTAIESNIRTIAKKTDEVKTTASTAVKEATDAAKETGEEGGSGIGAGIFDSIVNKINELFPGLGSTLQEKVNNAMSSVKVPSLQDFLKDMDLPGTDSIPMPKGKNGSSKLTDEDREEETKKDHDDNTNTSTNPTTAKKTSTTKKKTVAETIAEEYSKKLKANKYLQDALTKETTLWNLQNEDAVSNEELLAKRSETVAKAIELQTDRVQIAQEQYNELLKKAPKDDKTKDAYNTLLDEKASLEKLKQSRRDDIWEDVLSRYENDTKTAEDEYNLWASTYEKTASVTEKSNKKIEAINRKIGIQAEVVTAAEKDYTELKAEFGEQSQRTQEAYRKYLEEQKEQQDLVNELEEAQLEQFDNQISRYEKEYALIQNKQNMLAKIYDDGSLADQKSAYESAVNQYGEDSKEARAASRQGVMSALIATGTAVSNLADSYKKLAIYQGKYESIQDKTSDEALDAYAALQQEQYNFVGFAENLADAMDMGDSGKKAMMQLGYTISKNWQPIQNGFQKVWAKLPENMTTGLTQVMDLAMTEGAAETTSSLMQTVVAAMSGDYATAMVAGLNTVLNFMNTEFGKQVLDGVSTVMGKAAAALGGDSGTGLGLFTKLAGAAGTTTRALSGTAEVAGESVGLLAKLSGVLGTVGTKVTGLLQTAGLGLSKALGAVGASVSTILPEVSAALASVAGMLGPQGLIALAIGAVGAGTIGLMANWDKVKTWFGNFREWLREKFTGLWNGIKSFGQGVISGFKNLFGIHSPSTVMAEIGGNIMQGLENGIADSTEGVNRTLEEAGAGALEIATQSAEQLLQTLNNEDSYEPVIRPVVDLTDAREGTAWMRDNLNDTAYTAGINLTRTTELAGAVARNADRQKDADREREEPAADEMSNRDIVTAIGSLGDRIDGVADAVANMRLSIDKKKFVGEIIDDVDERLGKISKQRRR